VRRADLKILTASWKRNFGYFGLFEVVEWARVLQNLTLTQQQFVDLWEVRFRPGRSALDLVGAFGIESASPAAARGSRDLVVVRAPFHGFLKRLYFEYGVSFVPPLEFRRESIRVTIVGTEAAMRRALAYLRRSRIAFETLSAGAFPGPGRDPLALLTDKQRKALEFAFARGYFDVPCRTTSRQLARGLGISHQALLNTLHRSERRLIGALLSPEPSSASSK
jgi:hypothetical protein